MRRFALAVALAAVAAFASAGHAQIIGSFDSGNCYPFSCGPTDGVTTYQQVYSSAAFSGPITIDSLSFYQWPVDNAGGPMDPATYAVYLSTTSASVFGLSGNPADNIGPDNTLFGTFSISGDMPLVLTLTGNPFSYDPANGNLLMDVETLSGTSLGGYMSFFWADYTGVVTSRLYVNESGTTANDTGALVTGFNAVPEPSSLALGGIGVVAGLGYGWRRRRKAATA